MRKIAGFTLIEVMVALTIAAVVILVAHEIFSGVSDGSKIIGTARASLDRDVNGRRWLKATFLSLEPPFEGRTAHASFSAWELTAEGWFEPKPIELRQDGSQFIARSGSETFPLRDGVTNVALDYLLEPGAQTKWVSEWVSPVSAPLAVRLRVSGCGKRDAACVDTLFFLIKERG